MADTQTSTNPELNTLMTPEERRAHIVDLRRRGITFEKIGAELGITMQSAHEVYWRVMNERTAHNVNAIREEQNARLDYLYERAAEVERRKHVMVSGGKVVHETVFQKAADGTIMLGEDGKPIEVPGPPLIDDGPQLRAIAEMRAIEAERAKLNGTYAPVQATINGEIRFEIAGVDMDTLR